MRNSIYFRDTPGSGSGNYYKDACDRERIRIEEEDEEKIKEWEPVCEDLSSRWDDMTLEEKMMEVEENPRVVDYDDGENVTARWYDKSESDFLNEQFPLGVIGSYEEAEAYYEMRYQ